jgi:hypothetical protein
MRQISTSLAVRYRGLGFASAKLALLAAISLLLSAGRARAEPELSLSWPTQESLPGCPDLAWAMTRIESEIGRAPRADVHDGVHAIVTVEKRASGFLLSLRTEVGGAQGERVIEGDNCVELSEAAILIVALSVSEADQARAREQNGGSNARDPSERTGAKPDASTASGSAARGARITFLLRPELVVELGLLGKHPTLGPGLALGLAWGRYRVEAAGTWLLYGQREVDTEEIAVTLGAARVSGCALFGATRVRGGPCLGVELGKLRARNTQTNVESPTFWGAAALTARLLVGLGWRLSLVLDADLVASWGRLELLRAMGSGQSTQLYESLPVQLRTHLGLELSF